MTTFLIGMNDNEWTLDKEFSSRGEAVKWGLENREAIIKEYAGGTQKEFLVGERLQADLTASIHDVECMVESILNSMRDFHAERTVETVESNLPSNYSELTKSINKALEDWLGQEESPLANGELFSVSNVVEYKWEMVKPYTELNVFGKWFNIKGLHEDVKYTVLMVDGKYSLGRVTENNVLYIFCTFSAISDLVEELNIDYNTTKVFEEVHG